MTTIAPVPSHVGVSDANAESTKPASPADSDATASSDFKPSQVGEPTMTEHFYRYKVEMTCGGCSGAVTRVLNKAKETGAGVNSFTVSLEDQSVEVRGPIGFDDLTVRIEKTGKKILEKEEVVETPAEAPALAEATAQPVAVA